MRMGLGQRGLRHIPTLFITLATLAAPAVTVIATCAEPAGQTDSRKEPDGGTAERQDTVISEKESRTPAQRKLDSHLLFEIYRRRGEADRKHVPPGPTGVKIDEKGRAYVDVRADVTPKLQKQIESLGGTVVSTSVEYRSIVGWIPLLKLESLAEDPVVHSIQPPAQAATNRQP
jgi:hypothetical protein